MSIHDLEVDLDLRQNLNVYATCKQLDNLNLILNIYDNKVQADLNNYNVRLKAIKPDNIPLIQETSCIINNNIVTIAANEQLTTTSGKTLIELQFINRLTGLKKSTFNLVLNVAESTLQVNPSISTATYTLLEELENKLDQADVIVQQLDEVLQANNDLKITITNGNTLNSNLETNIGNCNTLNSHLESNIAKGDMLNSDLEATINVGNISKSSLDIANKEAESNIKILESMGDISELVQNVKGNGESINLINTQLSGKANDVDNLRTTTNKSITGAINELNSNKANKDGTLQNNLNADTVDGKHAENLAQNFSVSNADFNTLVKSGMYRFDAGNANCPGNLSYGQLLAIHGAGDTIAQICFGYSSNSAYMRMGNPSNVGGAGAWTPWVQIAHMETVDITTLLNGWTWWSNASFGSRKVTRVGNLVTVDMMVTNSSPNTSAIYTLPNGFRPLANLIVPMSYSGASPYTLPVQILTDGTVQCAVNPPVSGNWLHIHATFQTY